MWDLIVSVPDRCLSFYFASEFYGPLVLSSILVVKADRPVIDKILVFHGTYSLFS